MDVDTIKAMKVRRLAKEFRNRIPINMAIRLPDDITDKLKDDQIEDFFRYLKQFGLVKGSDFYWERQR